MDAVVLHSDIARLVLGYLKRHNLKRASQIFCKSSPHLKQEFSAYRKGFTPYTFGPDLEDIICEYVNITRTVDKIVALLPSNLRLQLFERKLPEKVKLLLEHSLDSYLKKEQSGSDTLKKIDSKHSPVGSTTLHSDKENTSKKNEKQKRKRVSLVSSSDERISPVALRHKSAKRRRILEPFFYLSAEQHNLQRQQKSLHTSSTGDDQTQTDDGIEEESVDEEYNELTEEVANVLYNESDLSLMEKPTKESTPRNKSAKGKFLTPSVPELSQVILDNPHFQMKLVDNINQVLGNSTGTETQVAMSNINTATAKLSPNSDALSEEQQIINSNEMLDQMVKDILKATEKDPAFDAIIENVVGVSVQPTNVSAGVQCNIENSVQQTLLSMPTLPAVVGQQQQPQHFTLVQQQQQQLTMPCLSTVSHDTSDPTTIPRTPLIIRTAVAAASSSLSGGGVYGVGAGESQVLSALTANNSFGSLIDPNFSISKLIVLNPNDSVPKQPTSADHNISNTTADHLINQLTSGNEGNGDEQVYFDTNTGQLTIPLFLTDEGLLANFPFLLNNETVSQQLQPDNICNLDGSRIEIPLAEPIIVSADQLPPNSIIVTSAQKAITEEEQRLPSAYQHTRTVCKKPKDMPAPSSLNAGPTAEGETPSTSGILNAKAYKSLSTPRKRTAHVRTLSFSPKIDANRAPVHAGASQLSTRRDFQRDAEIASKIAKDEDVILNRSAVTADKPIIKNVEILPRIDAPIDVSANESSNSCSVPPLFVTEESSNQTVIKTELSLKENKDYALGVKPKTGNNSKAAFGDHADTPKRKQVRRAAVRACKRQLSKSSDESEKPKSAVQFENSEAKVFPSESKENANQQKLAKESDDKMMQEWLRLRNATTSDLDSRLRQLNADQFATMPKSARRTRNTPSKRRKLRQKKPVISKRMRKKAAALEKSDPENDKSISDGEIEVDETKMDNASDKEQKKEVKIKQKSRKSKKGEEKTRSGKDKSLEFNIKIPTPQKDKRESLKKMRSSCADSVTVESTTDVYDGANKATFQKPTEQTNRIDHNPVVHRPVERLEQERGRRTANIACLLETPFKAPIGLGDVPPTPGLPIPSLDTPTSKLGDVPLSTSYLFGSLTKSELETPQLSAVTPGFRFTPFGSSRDVTPRSVAPVTDYSSGGSYYKPDESDDLDRKFDKLLRDSAQKQNQIDEENNLPEKHSNAGEVKRSLIEEQREPPEATSEQKEDTICVEIPAEKLRVEPIVLKRVKSFGSEGTENCESGTAYLNINPHYTLVSELPEICAQEESSNSSSTFSSSSSSSSDSSSTSSSSSSNSSLTAEREENADTGAEVQHKTPVNLNLSLDNLSTISSTEDEEWQRLAVTEEENSQLVSNDGEVRYPVRSWLTPSKADNQATAEAQERALSTMIKVTVPLKSAEKRIRLEDDLQLKRERMMEKLKQDASQRREKQSHISSTPPSGITAALTATRKIAAMREKGKIQPIKVLMPTSSSTVSESKPAKQGVVVEEKRSLEVLTALQLSARKPQLQTTASESKRQTHAGAPPISALDDNAMSTLFSSTSTSTAYELTEKTERLPLKRLISEVKAKQRQCMQIEPLPVLKPSRSSGVVRKKIVHKPLGFKGTLTADTMDDVEHIEEVQSPFRVATKSARSDGKVKDSELSSTPKIKVKTPTEPNVNTDSKIRVSPRLHANKSGKTRDIDEEDKQEAETKPLRARKTVKTIKTRATTAKTLLRARSKVSPKRTKITKIMKTAQRTELQTTKREITNDESSDVEVMETDEVQGEMHFKERNTNQEQEKYTEKEKSRKKTDLDRVKEETKSGKVTKLAKDMERTKSEDPKKSGDTPERVEVTKTKSTKSDIHLPTQELALAENLPVDTAGNRQTVLKPKISITEKTRIPVDTTRAKATKLVKSQEIRKNEINDQSKSNADIVSVENIKTNDQPTGKSFEENESTENSKTEVAQTSAERIATPTSTTNAELTPTETSEDDPLEGCELVSVTDDDPVRFISITYGGPEAPPSNALSRRDFSNFKMVVAFDEDEKHIWRITDELMLFHASPATQQIRNIPKKRKIRINTCGNDQDNVTAVGVVHSTTTTTLATTSATTTLTTGSSSDNAKKVSNSSKETKPNATSTPISAPATSSTHEPKKTLPKVSTTAAGVTSMEATSKASTSSILTKSTAQKSASTTEGLQMDDIESLLSHLHGNAN